MDVPGGVAGAAASLGVAAIKALAKRIKDRKVKAFPSREEYDALEGLKASSEFATYRAVVRDHAILYGGSLLHR